MEFVWNNIDDNEPVDNRKNGYGTEYLVTVKCDSWDKPKTMVMSWCEEEVRGKIKKRWKWKERLKEDTWIITHWAEFPKPATQEEDKN